MYIFGSRRLIKILLSTNIKFWVMYDNLVKVTLVNQIKIKTESEIAKIKLEIVNKTFQATQDKYINNYNAINER